MQQPHRARCVAANTLTVLAVSAHGSWHTRVAQNLVRLLTLSQCCVDVQMAPQILVLWDRSKAVAAMRRQDCKRLRKIWNAHEI